MGDFQKSFCILTRMSNKMEIPLCVKKNHQSSNYCFNFIFPLNSKRAMYGFNVQFPILKSK